MHLFRRRWKRRFWTVDWILLRTRWWMHVSKMGAKIFQHFPKFCLFHDNWSKNLNFPPWSEKCQNSKTIFSTVWPFLIPFSAFFKVLAIFWKLILASLQGGKFKFQKANFGHKTIKLQVTLEVLKIKGARILVNNKIEISQFELRFLLQKINQILIFCFKISQDFETCVRTFDRECRYLPGLKRDGFGDHRRQTMFFCGHSDDCT